MIHAGLVVEVNEICQSFFLEALPQSSEAAAYCTQRKLDARAASWLRLGFCPSLQGCDGLMSRLSKSGLTDEQLGEVGIWKVRPDGKLIHSILNRLTIPIMNAAGQAIGFTTRAVRSWQKPRYVNTRTSAAYKKGEELYNMDRARMASKEERSAILVEGCIKAEAINRIGHRCVVATQGTSLTEAQCYALAGLSREVVLAFDSDAAGAIATERAIPMLLAVGLDVKVARLTSGGPDDMLAEQGPMALVRAISTAQRWNLRRASS